MVHNRLLSGLVMLKTRPAFSANFESLQEDKCMLTSAEENALCVRAPAGHGTASASITVSCRRVRAQTSVSQSGSYRPLGGVEEMQGGGRRIRLEWGAYITV
ncbi:hypothetical protein FHG87_000386 [Trinorchestia longiramus]|nr:hypothetical protein FHG87_000386 [Trinorchestia longiramus]